MHVMFLLPVDLRHIQTSCSITINLSVFPGPENMGIAVEISLLSCIEDKIYVISYLHPVNGHHL